MIIQRTKIYVYNKWEACLIYKSYNPTTNAWALVLSRNVIERSSHVFMVIPSKNRPPIGSEAEAYDIELEFDKSSRESVDDVMVVNEQQIDRHTRLEIGSGSRL